MILCCGEALIDMLPRSTDQGQDAFMPETGGSVYNTAIALGRLGAAPGFFSGISTDLFGQMLLADLEESKVSTDHVVTSQRPTTLAFVKINDGQAEYAFYDENTAGRMLSPDDLPELGADVDALFFGGISLVVNPCADAYAALALRESGIRTIMLDPNIRPGFITDEAAYRERLDRLISAADIIKVSDEDLEWITGDTDPGVLLEKGPTIVLYTEGSKGARAISREFDVLVEANSVEVVDTVGAGDTFSAGVLAALNVHDHLSPKKLALANADNLRTALQFGVRAAAITVSRAGANPPWASEL